MKGKITVSAIYLMISACAAFSELIIVDNIPDAPHTFSTEGAWATATTAEGYYGANYTSADGSSSASARWQPSVTTSGYYKIYMKWTAASTRPDRIPVEITYDGGTKIDSTRRVNQKINGGVWAYLGTYYLQSGTNNSVSIEASDAGRICADAMLFELSYATTTSPEEPALTTAREEYPNDTGLIERPVAAPLVVYYNGGVQNNARLLDQTSTNSDWVSVGTYYLAAGTGNSLKLNASGQGVTAADAVKFELASDTNISVVVDNELPDGSPHAFTTAGNWTPATTPDGYYGANYIFATLYDSAARWRPNITTAGNYNVYIRWPDNTYAINTPEEVLIIRTDSGADGIEPVFGLRVEGAPFYVKGSCGTEALEEIAAAGGNTIRAYSVNAVSPDLLKRASDAGIKVILGLWLAQAKNSTADFYDNPSNVSNQFETLKTQIDTYKDYESILAWVIGNEITPTTVENPEPVYKAIQQVARYIRKVDHYHPCLTSHAGSHQIKIERVVQWAHDVDIIGINTYDPHILNATPNLITGGWNGPCFITEYFLRQPLSMGAAENGETSWGAVIEPVSSDKYSQLLDLYPDSILAQSNRVIGAFVFKGARGAFRVTHTWYPILDENLKPTPSYDAMRENWGIPAAPSLTAPQVTTIKLNNQYAWQNSIITAPDGILTSAVTVTAPSNAVLEYRVEIRTNASVSVNYPPPPLTGITITQNSVTPRIFYIKLADLPNGDYRLFYYVRRTDGAAPGDYISVGTANFPFRKAATNIYSLTTSVNNVEWGSATPTGGTYLAGSTVQLNATASPYYHFVQWSGDIAGTTSPTNIRINSDLTLQAVFTETQVTNGTPEWWLAQHGLETTDSAALTDDDQDGFAAWQEYIAGTDPTNPASALRATLLPGHSLQWQNVPGRIYTIYGTTNLLNGFQTLETNLTSGIFTGPASQTNRQNFYKIGVQLEP